MVDQLELSSPPQPSAAAPQPPLPASPIRRRVTVPAVLFVLTCLSTFWAGASTVPYEFLMTSYASGSLTPVRRVIWANAEYGLIYMAAIVGILLAHEMGHFVATLIYRPRSPIFCRSLSHRLERAERSFAWTVVTPTAARFSTSALRAPWRGWWLRCR
jgi:hypothetical protein